MILHTKKINRLRLTELARFAPGAFRYAFGLLSFYFILASGASSQTSPLDRDFFDSKPKPVFQPAAADPEAQGAFSHAVFTTAGSMVRGELSAYGKDFVELKRPDFSRSLRLATPTVTRIIVGAEDLQGDQIPPRMGTETPPEQQGKLRATVKVAGADWLYGELTSKDGQAFQLQINGTSALQIPREAIEWIYFSPHPQPATGFFGELNDLSGWTGFNWHELKMENGLLILPRGQCLATAIPATGRFEVDLEVQEGGDNGFGVWLQPMAMGADCFTQGTTQILLGDSELQHLTWGQGQMAPKTSPVAADLQGSAGRKRYRIFYDSTARHIAVFRNGRIAAEWDIAEKEEEKKALGNGPLEIQGIAINKRADPLKLYTMRVEPWNGVLPSGAPSALQPGECILTIPGPDKSSERTGRIGALSDHDCTIAEQKTTLTNGVMLRLGSTPKNSDTETTSILLGENGRLRVTGLSVDAGVAHFSTSFSNGDSLPLSCIHAIHQSEKSENWPGSVLVFRTGEQLPGDLKRWGLGESLIWRTALRDEIEVATDRVAGVLLNSALETPHCEVDLTNGDRLMTSVVLADAANITIKNDAFGEKLIGRIDCSRVFPNSAEAPIQVHPARAFSDALEPATGPNLSSPYFDGRCLGNLDNVNSRQFDYSPDFTADNLPDQYELDFLASQTGFERPSFSLLLTPSRQNQSAGGNIQINDFTGNLSSYCWRPNKNGMVRPRMEQFSLQDKLKHEMSTLNIRAFVDHKIGSLWLYADGVLISKTGEDNTYPGIGGMISLTGSGFAQNPSLIVDPRILPWHGDFSRTPADGESLELSNGDRAFGTLKQIEDKGAAMETNLGTLTFALDHISWIDLNHPVQPKRAAARIRLRDGTVLHAGSFHWDGESLVLHSEMLGDMTLSASAVSELVRTPDQLGEPSQLVKQ